MGEEVYVFDFLPNTKVLGLMPIRIATTNEPDAGERWTAMQVFDDRMNGAPVYNASGKLIGLAKGGTPWITPIHFAEKLLNKVPSQQCESTGSMSERKAENPYKAKTVVRVVIQTVDAKSGKAVSDADIKLTRIVDGKSREEFAGARTGPQGQFKMEAEARGRLLIEAKAKCHEDVKAEIAPSYEEKIHVIIPMMEVRDCSANPTLSSSQSKAGDPDRNLAGMAR